MASIRKLKKPDGSIVYDVRITFKKDGVVLHRESKRFNSKQIAQAWAKKRESEVESDLALLGDVVNKVTWAEVAKSHLSYLNSQDNLKRTKRTTIEFLLKRPIAQMQISEINEKHIIKHLRDRIIQDGAKPQTVNNDLAYIGSVMRYGVAMMDLTVNLNALAIAKEMAQQHHLIARPEKRERRITPKEQTDLIEFFERHRVKKYMVDIVLFALESARRQAEITQLRWDDLDIENSMIKVRDLKHPTMRGVTKTAKLTKEAMAIIMRQPKTSETIFTRNPKTLGANFQQACKILEIKDLRFHDLRHEATSRLFEAGYSITEVQQFTLHEDWKTLRRYTHLRPENLKLK